MLAVTTLAFAVMTSSFLLNRDQSFLGISFDYLPDSLIDRVERYPIFGIHSILGQRLVTDGPDARLNETGMYFVCLLGLGLVLLAVRGLHRWRTVRDLIATRDNERNAQAFGLSPTKAKLLAFAIAGFFASFAGGILALAPERGRPGDLRPDAEHPRARPWRWSAGSARCPARSSARSS